MARDRQRAKQRQAQRRAERPAERGDGGAGTPTRAGDGDGATNDLVEDEARVEERPTEAELEELVDLEVGAPPRDTGHSEAVTRHEEPPPPDLRVDESEEDPD